MSVLLGELVRRRRRDKGLTRAQMAASLGICGQAYRWIECGGLAEEEDLFKLSDLVSLAACHEERRLIDGIPEGQRPTWELLGMQALECHRGVWDSAGEVHLCADFEAEVEE